jgi:hypothetical protein
MTNDLLKQPAFFSALFIFSCLMPVDLQVKYNIKYILFLTTYFNIRT